MIIVYLKILPLDTSVSLFFCFLADERKKNFNE